jgi:putative flippase GtrA
LSRHPSRDHCARPDGLRQLTVFCAVGGAAFVTHFLVVVAIVPLGPAPLIANIIGFACAFAVSFLGHNHLTFPGPPDRNKLRALHRFLRVALLGFAANESLFWLLLRFTAMPYQLALILVLLVVAASTLVFSRQWAFADG